MTAEEAALNVQLARVYSSNSPFACIKNKEFFKLIEMRPVTNLRTDIK